MMFFFKKKCTAIQRMTPVFLAIWVASAGWAHEAPGPSGIDKPNLENLGKTVLEGPENTEVILSRVSLPGNTTLPKHWHPGEEIGYVVEGQITLQLDGYPDQIFEAGQQATVPFAQVHTVTSGPDGALLVVFRVHETGKPERVLLTEAAMRF